MSREWTAKWIGPEAGDQSHPVIFKDFYIDDEIKQATLYITSLGIFEAYVNGQRVGTEYLTPYQSAGDEGVQYFSFDVTDLLNCGPDSEANSVDIFLGRGWNEEEERFAVKAEFEIEVFKNKSDVLEESAEEDEPQEDFAEDTELREENSLNEEEFDEIFDDDFLEDVIAEESDLDTIFEDLEEDRVELLAIKGDEKSGPANEPFELDDLNDLDDFLERVIDTPEAAKEQSQPQRRRNVGFFTMAQEQQEEKAQVEEKVQVEDKTLSTEEEVSEDKDPDDLEIFDFEDWDDEDTETAAAEEEIIEEAEEAIEETEEVESPNVDLTVAPYSITDEELEALFDAPLEDTSAEETETGDDLFSEETLDALLDETLFPEEAEAEEAETDAPEEAEAAEEEEVPEEETAEEETEELPEETEDTAEAASEETEEIEEEIEEAEAEVIAAAVPLPETEAAEKVLETLIIATDETWGYYASDIEYSSIHSGEVFNRLLWEEVDNPEKSVEVIDLDIPLTERYSLPVIVKERLEVQEVIPAGDGAQILDFGQSFSGFVTFNSSLSKGSTVRLSFAEELTDDAFEGEDENAGFTYISDGMPEVVGPHFTYFTGRYVKVSGWEGKVDPKDFVGCVIYSDMKRTGFIATSNERLDAIYEELLSVQKRTSVVMPEEGEPADVFAYAPAASYNMDVKEFLGQYLKGIKAEPADDSLAYIPQIVWNQYRMYGDEAVLTDNYELMKAWVDQIDAKDAERSEKHFLCDFETDTEAWVSMDQETETEFIASACYYEDARLVGEAAAVIGNEQDAFKYSRLARRIKQAFLEEYYTAAGRLSVDTQTAYVLALQFGLYVDRARVASGLEKRLAKDGNVLKCAPAATPFVCKVLADNGMPEKAYDILLDKKQKSFNNEVEFIYSYMAGIKVLEPGFALIGLEPVPDGRVDYCMSSFESPVGTVISNWTIKEDGSLNFHFEVPEGANAKIALPYYPVCAAGGNEVIVKNGSYDYSYMPSVTLKREEEPEEELTEEKETEENHSADEPRKIYFL